MLQRNFPLPFPFLYHTFESKNLEPLERINFSSRLAITAQEIRNIRGWLVRSRL